MSMTDIYNDCIGKHDELLSSASKDKYGNPSGAQYDLVRDNAYDNERLLIGNFYNHMNIERNPSEILLAKFIPAIQAKGFKVVEVNTEAEFINGLKTADVAGFISGNTIFSHEFTAACRKYHESGRGLWVWADNSPYTSHANAFLNLMYGFTLDGCEMANKVLKLSESEVPTAGTFKRHVITTGIVSLYEGITISHPTNVSPKWKVLATSTEGHPVSLFLDNEYSPSTGRMLLDCGFTKLYINWDDAGTARYIVNGFSWLMAPERNRNISSEKIPCEFGADCHNHESIHRAMYSHPSESHSPHGDDEYDVSEKVKSMSVDSRTPCRYGSSCYNRSSAHMAQYSHPRDNHTHTHDHDDIKTKATSSTKSKPVCKYGASCYRRNPEHLANYSHPK